MYLHAKIYQNIPSGLKVLAIFTNWLRVDGHYSAKLYIKKSGICKISWLDHVNMYLHAENY